MTQHLLSVPAPFYSDTSGVLWPQGDPFIVLVEQCIQERKQSMGAARSSWACVEATSRNVGLSRTRLLRHSGRMEHRLSLDHSDQPVAGWGSVLDARDTGLPCLWRSRL